LIPLGDKPIMEILLYQMRRAGITDVVLTVGYLSELLSAYFGTGDRFGVKISYSFEKKPLGTSGPLSIIEGLDDTFLVANGDVLCDMHIDQLIASHKESGAIATIAMYQRQVNIDLGVIELNGDHEIIGYIEKPRYVYPVSMGLYVFEPKVLAYIPENEYLDFPDLVHILIENGERVRGYPFQGYWRDLGRPDDYESAMHDFYQMREKFLPGEVDA
jgi:NDP-sugar pyrophosphorylase family protein